LLVVAASPYVRGSAILDDGWRRTAQGWELLHAGAPAREVLTSQRTMPISSPFFHPLLLAALQVSIVATAYWRFPVKWESR
jgi:hypothetical protein